MKVNVPPIKSQGIKTRLVPWINNIIPPEFCGRWVEPFMGTGVVAFNLAPKRAVLCDINPHLIDFYQAISDGDITLEIVSEFLKAEGARLLENGESHYYQLRERFNKEHQPLDFLFLNRSGFNGLIRFNQKGGYNVPFCKKPRRFAQAYITKIVNQVSYVSRLLKVKDFVFKNQSFEETLAEVKEGDIIYCDPPYIDRHVDYYSGWDADCEKRLYDILSRTGNRFILSTWHHNDYRKNEYIKSYWDNFNILTCEHFYHVGGNEGNRNSMIEAIVTNYKTPIPVHAFRQQENLMLLDTQTRDL